MSKSPLKTFEDCIDIINELIKRAKPKWTLAAISSLDYDDVSQILRIHIWKKWDLYEQTKPLEPWVSTVILNQIRNLRRNLYDSMSRPCLRCAAAEGENLCSIYTTQNSICPLYAYWESHKKNAFNVRLPVSIEQHTNEISEMPNNQDNTSYLEKNLHETMLKNLKPVEQKIYDCLYIKGLTEEETAKKMGYITKEKGRKAGYNSIMKAKKLIISKVKELISKGEIETQGF